MVLRFFLFASVFLFMSCGYERDNPYDPGSSNFRGNTFSYQGRTYKYVKIGTQTWMAENLNYDVSGSVCYGNSEANCTKYGRLYNWATAMALPSSCNSSSCSEIIGEKHQGICPSGWHIPSYDDWDKLITAVGGDETAGRYLKATSGWNNRDGNGVNGVDKYGFSALPGGYVRSDGLFLYVGHYGIWWSSSEYDSDYAYYRHIYYSYEGVVYGGSNKGYLYSVRCLQD